MQSLMQFIKLTLPLVWVEDCVETSPIGYLDSGQMRLYPTVPYFSQFSRLGLSCCHL